MWIVHTTKAGETMDTIIAKFKIKDPATVLTHKANKSIYKDLKAGKELPKGTKVTIPDPKGKVYVVKTKSGTQYMNEATYKAYLKEVHAKMDEAIFKLKQKLTYAQGRHDAQNKINDDQWFVAACISLVNRVPEPKSRKKAESAFSAAEKACKARNYKAFEKTIEPANIAIAKYSNEVLNWIEGIINAGEGTVTVLEGVKSVGMVCGAVAATTVIAPVGLAAGVLTGAGVGAGTSMTFDGFENIGRVAAGTKPRSVDDTLKRAAGSALAGAAGAAVVGVIMKYAGPHIVKFATSNKFLENQVKRIISNGPLNLKELYAAEVKVMVQKLGINSTDALIKARGGIMGVAVSKFLLRVTAGSLNKYLGTGKWLTGQITKWVTGDTKRVSGKDPNKTAQAFASDLTASGEMDGVFDSIVKDNQKKLVAILREEIKAAALVELKKQRA